MTQTASVSAEAVKTAADTFRQAFPRVKLQPDKLIPDEKGIYTNAGAYSFLNLLI